MEKYYITRTDRVVKMLVYKGKYNYTKVMIDKIDETTVSQIYTFLNHPAFKDMQIRIMPDCHAGTGAVIGFTATMNEYIIPNIVGVDIGCGVVAYNLGKIDVDFEELDNFIRENIPSGFNVYDKPLEELEAVSNLVQNIEYIANQIDTIDYTRTLCSLGTLGGGNHFIELNRDPDDNVWLTIHTGSRKFGLDIANYHQKKAQELMKTMFHGASSFKKLEFLPIKIGGEDYLRDMRVAQEFANTNRNLIAYKIIYEFFNLKDINYRIRSIHNYINFNDNIIRKGAISAHKGEKVIIPLNMRDGTIIGTGKGNKDWNFSAPHGAGRILSRKKAKEELTIEEFEKEMKDVWTSCVQQSTLDESPMAYKDKNIILDTIGETVDIDFIMKPIYNFKAT